VFLGLHVEYVNGNKMIIQLINYVISNFSRMENLICMLSWTFKLKIVSSI